MGRARGPSKFFQASRRFNKQILQKEISEDFYEILDKFASRYGWEEEKILSMPAISFFGYYFAMKKAEEKEQLNQYKAAAFTAWRIESNLSQIVHSIAGGKADLPEFNDFLEANRLLTPYERKQWQGLKKLRKKLEEREARQKHDFANVIMLADKQRQKSLQETSRGKGDT